MCTVCGGVTGIVMFGRWWRESDGSNAHGRGRGSVRDRDRDGDRGRGRDVAVAVIRGRGRARGSRSGGAGLKQATRDEGRADQTTLRPSPPPPPAVSTRTGGESALRGQVVSLFDPAIAPVGC